MKVKSNKTKKTATKASTKKGGSRKAKAAPEVDANDEPALVTTDAEPAPEFEIPQPEATVDEPATEEIVGETPERVDVVPGSIADISAKYLNAIDGDKTPSTVRSYGMDLQRACSYFGAERLVETISADEVQGYFDSPEVNSLRSGKPKAKPTIDKQCRVLRLALVWAAEQKLIEVAPVPADKKPD